MTDAHTIQGRQIGAPELAQVRALLAEHPDLSRRQLSQQLARRRGSAAPAINSLDGTPPPGSAA